MDFISPLVGACGRRDRLLALCPQFRLMQRIERLRSDGSLTEIDALLACGVVTFSRSLVETFDELSTVAKTIVCTQLFFTINWFREV